MESEPENNAYNLRDEVIQSFKDTFKKRLVILLKLRDPEELYKNLEKEVKKVYTSTTLHEHITAEGKKGDIVRAAVSWLKPILAKRIAAEEARPAYAPRQSRIKREFMKRSFLAGHTLRVRSPPKNGATRSRRHTLSLAAPSAAMNMGSLSRALNDIFK